MTPTGIPFADASAVVKRYVDEEASEAVRSLSLLIVSDLTRVEVPAAIWRKQTVEGRAVSDAATLVAGFEADWRDRELLAPVALVPPVLEQAAALAARHRLRAGDAIQLASAIAARDVEPSCTTLWCFDRHLADAASIEGFSIGPASS